MGPLTRALTAVCATTLLLGCGSSAVLQEPFDLRFQREEEEPIATRPRRRGSAPWWDQLDGTLTGQLGALLSPARQLDRAGFAPEALDVNAFGEVPDSSWFDNRLGRRVPTAAEVVRGPAEGPLDTRALLVLGAKEGGTQPGLFVRDGSGRRWVVKFDPPANPELSTGAEVVATKLLHALGWHVPDNRLGWFAPSALTLSPDATTLDSHGVRVRLDERRLGELLSQLNPDRDGRLRGLFSRVLDDSLGPTPLAGVRADDPNDRLPHERRRSRRGLRLVYAWLANTDAGEDDTLDVWRRGPRGGHVVHYVLDFGRALGSASSGPKSPVEGHDHLVDIDRIGERLFTFGAVQPWWAHVRQSPWRSVGTFEATAFDPRRYRPLAPNPAFEEATAADRYWAGHLLARLGEPQLRAAVEAAAYSEPGAAAYVLATLLKRRQVALNHAFGHALALDEPSVTGSAVRFRDLQQENGLVGPGAFVFELHGDDDGRALVAGIGAAPQIELRRWLDLAGESKRFYSLRVCRAQGAVPRCAGASSVRLRLVRFDGPRGVELAPIGLER